MVTILMQPWLTFRPPISLPRDFPASIENIHGAVDAGIPVEGWLIRRVEIAFFQFIPVRIVFPSDDRVATRDNDRFTVDADEGRRYFITTFIILRLPSMIAIL